MTVRNNSAAGIPLLTELAVGDTGGTSGDAFSSLTRGGTISVTGEDISSKRWYRLSAPANADTATINWNETTFPAAGSIRYHLKVNNVGTLVQLMNWQGAAGAMARLAINPSNGSLQLFNAASNATAVWTSATGVFPNDGSEFVLEAALDPGTSTTTGRMLIRVWTGSPLTATYNIEHTAQNFFRTGGITSRRWGKFNGNSTALYYMRQMRTEDSYALIGPAVETPPVTMPTGEYAVLWLTGASNMRGAATDYDAAGVDAYPANVYQFAASGPNVGQIIPAVEPIYHGDASLGMGPVNTFIKAMRTAGDTRPVLIVPSARGGTGFVTPDSNGGSLSWRTDLANTANNLYEVAKTMYTSALAALTAAGGTANLVAILHNAGTTDSSSNMTATTWRGYMLPLLNGLRAHAGTTKPFLFMQSRPDLIANETRHAVIDQAARDVVATERYTAYAYSPNSAEYFKADAVHFNAAGQRVIGQNLYNVLDDAVLNAPEYEWYTQRAGVLIRVVPTLF